MMKGYMAASVSCLDTHHKDEINRDEKDDQCDDIFDVLVCLFTQHIDNEQTHNRFQ